MFKPNLPQQVQQNIKVTSPKGNAEWAKVFIPDTKYVPQGEYSITVVLSEVNASELKKTIDKVVEEQHAIQVKELAAKKKFGVEVKKSFPYTYEYDSEGNATGNIKFKFKCKAEVVLKDGTKINNKPKIFDAQSNPDNYTKEIWNGSLVRASGEVIPFYTASVGAGATLRLKAVQIINLVTKGTSTVAGDSFGFDKEDGYVATQAETFEESFIEREEEDFHSEQLIKEESKPEQKKVVLAFNKPKVNVQTTTEEDDFFGDDNPF